MHSSRMRANLCNGCQWMAVPMGMGACLLVGGWSLLLGALPTSRGVCLLGGAYFWGVGVCLLGGGVLLLGGVCLLGGVPTSRVCLLPGWGGVHFWGMSALHPPGQTMGQATHHHPQDGPHTPQDSPPLDGPGIRYRK